MIDRAVRIISQIIIILIIVQALTGVLLSLHYTPDAGPAEVRQGEPGTIVHAKTTMVRVAPQGALQGAPQGAPQGGAADTHADTLALAGDHALVPAGPDDIVPSGAAASVSLTIEHHVPGGNIIRRIHHTNTSIIIVALMVLLVLFVKQRAWLTHGVVWSSMIVVALVLMGAAFTGRLLPDDVYSNVSAVIVRHGLSEAPFGQALNTMLGLSASESARLSTPYAIHTLFLPAFLAFGICLLWRSAWQSLVVSSLRDLPLRISIICCALAVALCALLPVAYYPVRDMSNGVQQSVSAEPWWPFVVPNALASWLGGELAGYLALAAFLALATLPLWARRTR